METKTVEVQHASRNFRNPHWTFEYEMVKINRTFLEMRHGYNNHDDTLYYHITKFTPILS